MSPSLTTVQWHQAREHCCTALAHVCLQNFTAQETLTPGCRLPQPLVLTQWLPSSLSLRLYVLPVRGI